MSRYWSNLVNGLTPYIPGEQPQLDKLTKLNTNECPYDPSPEVLAAIAGVSGERLRRYPDPESCALKKAFADKNGLEAEQIFLGNGSDEVLAHAVQALLVKDGPVCFPDISYSFYPVWCDLYQTDYRQVPLAPDYTVDPAAYPEDAGGIIIPNPNAPTGILMATREVQALLAANPDTVVVIDEAYIDFGGESAVGLIDDHDNLLVIQTLSKSRALAGLRVGVAMGHRDLIEGLNRVKNSFNSYPLDVLAQEAALASLRDEAYFEKSVARVIVTRERLTAELATLGFEVLPSHANFVFARHPQRRASELFQALRAEGIIVRYFDQPRIDQFLRISIGTDEQTDLLLASLGKMLAA